MELKIRDWLVVRNPSIQPTAIRVNRNGSIVIYGKNPIQREVYNPNEKLVTLDETLYSC